MSDLDQMRKGTTTVVLLRLLEDAGQPMHGYEIIRRLEARSDGTFQFKEGLIYPALHRMEQDGLLKSAWQETETQRRRKVYWVTEQGRRELERELRRWQDFRESLDQLLGLVEAPL